jgi:hypothetical protein
LRGVVAIGIGDPQIQLMYDAMVVSNKTSFPGDASESRLLGV